MPTYRDISISLQSQYDALTIPEYPLPGALTRDEDSPPFPCGTQTACFSIANATVEIPDPEVHVAEIGIPVYPSSQFWISYACPPPFSSREFRFWYLKLFIDGDCLVSWGAGEQEDYDGKTMFNLCDSGTDFEGKRVVVKRAFFFPSEDEIIGKPTGGFEIQVFRSKARKREPTASGSYSAGTAGNGQLRQD